MLEFEKTMQELDEIVKKMESKDTTLDESLELFNKGLEKSKACMDSLTKSKGKLELLVKELEGITGVELNLDKN